MHHISPKVNSAKMLYQRMGFSYEREMTIFNEVYHLYVSILTHLTAN